MMQHGPIVDLTARHRKKIVDQIRIHHEEFEYRYLTDYDLKIELDKTDCIELGDSFIQIIKSQGQYILLSILFNREKNSVDSVVSWLEKHQVEIFAKGIDSLQIENVKEVIDAVTFLGQPLVLYTKGKNKVVINVTDLIEVTEGYKKFHTISNTTDYLSVIDDNDKDEFGLVAKDYQFDEFEKDDALGEYPGVEEE